MQRERLAVWLIRQGSVLEMQYSWPKVILAVWLISSAFMIYGLTRIDDIVNHELYSFGLTFSHAWADLYWTFLWTTVLCISLPATLSAGVLLLDVWKRIRRAPTVNRVENNVATDRAAPVVQTATSDTSMMISCPKCRKLFGKPMNMLDFSSGKAQLINVCPYCNHVLGDAGHVDTNARAIEPDEKEKIAERT